MKIYDRILLIIIIMVLSGILGATLDIKYNISYMKDDIAKIASYYKGK